MLKMNCVIYDVLKHFSCKIEVNMHNLYIHVYIIFFEDPVSSFPHRV